MPTVEYYYLKKAGTSGSCCIGELLGGRYAEWPKPVTKMQIPHGSTSMKSWQSQAMQTNAEGGWPGAEVKGELGSHRSMGTQVKVFQGLGAQPRKYPYHFWTVHLKRLS